MAAGFRVPAAWAVWTAVSAGRAGRVLGAPECPAQWEAVGEHCFLLSPDDHTFESCQLDFCGPKGGTLACVRAAESTWLAWKIGLGRSHDIVAVWVGYSDAGPGDDWAWINGCDSKWTHWHRGEPDNYCGGEDCAAMTGASGGWMDTSCRLRLPCLCEFGGTLTAKYNASITEMRDDTCYADCGDLTKWCTAWPFARLYDVNSDICHWEEKDGQKRGRGASECAQRVKVNPACGQYYSYSAGSCRCSPAAGDHSECMYRQVDATSDIFFIEHNGSVVLEYARQHCVYTMPVDPEYFARLRPATTFWDSFKFYARAAAIWWTFGLPCVMIAAVSLLRTCACCASTLEELPELDGGGADGQIQGGHDASYGPLIDSNSDDGAGEAVNRWVFRGAVGAIFYGIGLLALGATLAMHMAQPSSSFGLEVFEALVMAIAMAMDARAATMVHRKLSPLAKQVVGCWVLMLALAKHGLAFTAFAGVVVFSTLADRDYENICFAEYMFRWSMLLALPLQCLAGLSLSRVQVRAEPYVGSMSRMNGWVPLLVFGTFSSGLGIWCAGYLDCVHEAVIAVAIFFIVAALGQLSAGVAMLQINRKVKKRFEAAAAAEEAAQSPTDRELATRYGHSAEVDEDNGEPGAPTSPPVVCKDEV